MNQRKSSGRPSGTDGSDFSFRMVVDSRYTKVAKGKSRLYSVILIQAVIQFLGLLFLIPPISKRSGPDILAISASATGFVALLIGELGRRHSRASFLTIYAVTSLVAIFISIYSTISSNSMLGVHWNLSDWETKKFELVDTLLLLLRLVVQIFAISTVISLIHNMAPPKKAS